MKVELIDWDATFKPKTAEGQLFAGMIAKLNELIAAHNALVEVVEHNAGLPPNVAYDAPPQAKRKDRNI